MNITSTKVVICDTELVRVCEFGSHTGRITLDQHMLTERQEGVFLNKVQLTCSGTEYIKRGDSQVTVHERM